MKRSDTPSPLDFPDIEGPISMESAEDSSSVHGGVDPTNFAGDPARIGGMVTGLRLMWEQRRFLMRFTAAGMVLTLVLALLISNSYKSTARLMPPDSQANSGMAMAAAALAGSTTGLGGLAGEVLGMKSTSDLLAGVLESRTVQDKLVQDFDLKKVYSVSRMEDARKRLANQTDINIDRKSQIITISVTDKSAKRAAAIAQDYVEELNRRLAEVSTSAARRERIFLEDRLKAVNQDLESAEKEFGDFASKNSAIDIKEQGKAMFEAAATLQGQLIGEKSELEALRQVYADSNVRVRSVEARIAELDAQLKKVGGQYDPASADKSPTGDDGYPSIRQLPVLGVTYADLYRKTRVEETVYATLTQQYELARVQEAKEIPTVKVLDPPNVPEKKSFPPRVLLLLLGTALSFWCGAACLFAGERWRNIDSADPGKLLAQEVFTTVQAALPWASRNGHAASAGSEGVSNHSKPSKSSLS